jgi:predicted  nucleic acid-binding Zn-ribbon protein
LGFFKDSRLLGGYSPSQGRGNQERLATKLEANHEDMADLKTQIGCLASRIDVNQERVEVSHLEMKAHQWKTEDTVRCIQFELEDTVKHRVEDVLANVDQRTQGLRKELNEKIGEKQADLSISESGFLRTI